MAKTTIHRIKEYIDYKGISVRLFEKSIGMSNGSFASQLKNDKTIGVDKVENILHIYSEINPDWLLTGTGPMLRPVLLMSDDEIDRQDKEVEAGKWQVSSATPHEFSYLIEKIQSLAVENALLKKENDELKQSRGKSIGIIPYSDSSPKIGTHLAAEPKHK